MTKTITIRFYEELNDFLPAERRKQAFVHEYINQPTVKDLCESLGVPHTEIDLILVNDKSVGFDYQIQDGDRIAVYPVFEALDIGSVTHLRPTPLREPKFILDVHLGKLARYLRMLGFDTLYQNNYKDEEIIADIKKENRILLTRDLGLLKHKIVTHGYFVRHTKPRLQLQEILTKFDLFSLISPFVRCIKCNGMLAPVEKQAVIDQLPPKTAQYYDDYFMCDQCHKIYWRGTHYAKMQLFIDALKPGAGS